MKIQYQTELNIPKKENLIKIPIIVRWSLIIKHHCKGLLREKKIVDIKNPASEMKSRIKAL